MPPVRPDAVWVGLWDNSNIYGMLMGAGVVLAIGLREGVRSSEFGVRNQTKDSVLSQPRHFFCRYQIRNPQSAIPNSFGCGGDDGGGVGVQLQPGRMDGNCHWFALFGKGL
jgi:hypothetical protein